MKDFLRRVPGLLLRLEASLAPQEVRQVLECACPLAL